MILGVGGVGKTWVLESLKSKYGSVPGLESNQIVPTVGLNLARLEAIPHCLNGVCMFWDLGGRKSLRKIWSRYYTECDGLVFVVCDRDTDQTNKSLEEGIDEQVDVLKNLLKVEQLHGAPVLVLVNNDGNSQIDLATIEDVLDKSPRNLRATNVVSMTPSSNSLDRGIKWLIENTVSSVRTKERIARAG